MLRWQAHLSLFYYFFKKINLNKNKNKEKLKKKNFKKYKGWPATPFGLAGHPSIA
jgi:hypothetical protein